MATDVDVQYFSHSNGLTLGNNWGDLIRLLDKALVTGIDFTQITAASIDAQGDVHITLYAAHNAMLFQVVELSGFAPVSLNQKYRIKGVPNTTQLILKPALDIAERSITVIGMGKLAPLGYDIIFRDVGDVKRVYRAKNPTAQHPFIRVDESLASDTGSYTATYAKYAMVGLLEHMEHIDDYENLNVAQLPVSVSNPKFNWDIYNGSGSSVVRGWSRWYWRRSASWGGSGADNLSPPTGNAQFALIGDFNAFYFLPSLTPSTPRDLVLYGAGVFESATDGSTIPPWFLMSTLRYNKTAGESQTLWSLDGGLPLLHSKNVASFIVPKLEENNPLPSTATGYPIMPDYQSGSSVLGLTPQTDVNLTIPFHDSPSRLRGVLPHVLYNAGVSLEDITTPTVRVTGSSVYMIAPAYHPSHRKSGFSFYLGEV
ncbi:hypothetical protein [Acinetobacter pecorum]|uniref:Uncharacterized protein n=1 Tax=Acinetobacter pecorum TaxID=2762215 RepID=A0ABR8VWG5_9GAMM|nr:hypothetical protein [Acinetobacter pecorum]MBD8008751.1 hypothetical protein [Acinetobacter pecorum]